MCGLWKGGLMSADHAAIHVTKREALFALLRDGAWHAHYELARVGGVRYSARLLELKRLGYSIESEESATGQGKSYRMPSTTAGTGQSKRVKVYLEESDVDVMVARGYIPPLARDALTDARASFLANRSKL